MCVLHPPVQAASPLQFNFNSYKTGNGIFLWTVDCSVSWEGKLLLVYRDYSCDSTLGLLFGNALWVQVPTPHNYSDLHIVPTYSDSKFELIICSLNDWTLRTDHLHTTQLLASADSTKPCVKVASFSAHFLNLLNLKKRCFSGKN